MFDVQAIVDWLQHLSPLGVYVALWLTTYIENIFPPSPSDVVMLFIATLVGLGTIDFIPTLAVATLGSVMGFLTAFFLGRRFGRSITRSGKFPFLTKNALQKVDSWFERYGYWVIVGNRFLAGTRAVVSFFAGMSELSVARTTVLCAVSALAWNGLIIELGKVVGSNWEKGAQILHRYGVIVSTILGVIILFFVGRWIVRRIKGGSDNPVDNQESGPV